MLSPFDSAELIEKAIRHINNELFVSELTLYRLQGRADR